MPFHPRPPMAVTWHTSTSAPSFWSSSSQICCFWDSRSLGPFTSTNCNHGNAKNTFTSVHSHQNHVQGLWHWAYNAMNKYEFKGLNVNTRNKTESLTGFNFDVTSPCRFWQTCSTPPSLADRLDSAGNPLPCVWSFPPKTLHPDMTPDSTKTMIHIQP